MKHLAVQFVNDLIYTEPETRTQAIFNYNIWQQKYYKKPDTYWEIPKWVAELDYLLLNNNIKLEYKQVYKINTLLIADRTIVYGSVLDVNLHLWIEFIKINPGITFELGGYVNPNSFKGFNNVYFNTSMKELVFRHSLEYYYGTYYRLFKDVKCIPRITLSTGCNHNCSFCTIENKVKELEMHEILAQVMNLSPLDFNLIYIDDKTFGQANNYKLLDIIYEIIYYQNFDFKGFIVQTTALQIRNHPEQFESKYIYAVEIGVETYNDNILTKLHKPATEETIEWAVTLLEQRGIKVIPNIVVGFTEETLTSYSKTIKWLHTHKFKHVNLTNLAVYENTEMFDKLNAVKEDSNQLSHIKSFSSGNRTQLNMNVTEHIMETINKHNK